MRSVNSEFHALLRRVSPCVRFVGERREKVSIKTVCAVFERLSRFLDSTPL